MAPRVLLLVGLVALASLSLVSASASLFEMEYGVDTSYPCYGRWSGSRRVPMGCNGENCGDTVYAQCFNTREKCERVCNPAPATYEPDPVDPNRSVGENDIMRRYDALPCIKACTDAWIKCDGECFARKTAAIEAKKAADAAAWAVAHKAQADAAAAAQAAAAAKKAEEDRANQARIAADRARAEEAERARRQAEANKPAPVVPQPNPRTNKRGNGGVLQPHPAPKPAKPTKVTPAKRLQANINNVQVNTNIKTNVRNNVNINSGNTVNNVVNNNNNAGQVNIGSVNVNGGGDVTINVRLLDSKDLDETKPASKSTRKRVCTQANIQKYPELQLPCLCTAAQKKTFPQILDDCEAYDKKVAERKAAEKAAKKKLL